MSRLLCLTLALSLTATGAAAQTPGMNTVPRTTESMAFVPDINQRMTVPVTVGGRGPFRFVVDTGAERTVIARELAAALGLAPGRIVRLASLADIREVPTVTIPTLAFGRQSISNIEAPALAQEYLGAEGMIGVDALEDQRVIFDFRNRILRFSQAGSNRENWGSDTIVVRGRTRLGRMVLADVMVEGQRVAAIVDTGSAVTIGNAALRDRLIGRGRIDPAQVIELTSVTGARISMNYTRTRRIMIGSAQLHDLPIAFADIGLFRELGIENRPAILLGMDALQLFDRVAIDFSSRRIQLLPPDDTGERRGFDMRMARAR